LNGHIQLENNEESGVRVTITWPK